MELKSNILDIGCFDGKLLYFLSKKLKKSSLTGLEINKKLKKNFPSGKRFKFINDFEKLPKKYDAIILHIRSCTSKSWINFLAKS